MSTETATWPIRVGGKYNRSTEQLYKNIWSIVTRIENDRVYFENWFIGEEKPYRSDCVFVESFRNLHHPEDQSPISALVAALTAVQWGNGRCVACQRTQEEGHYEGCAVAEALGKAGAQ